MGSAHARLISGFIPLVIACTGDSVSPPPSVATISVSLTAASVQVGGATQALAMLRDATGNVLTGRTVAWNSLAPSVATVSPTGVVTGVSPGLAQIRATSETVSGEGTLQVTAVPVAAVVVTLAQSSIGVGATTQASATLRDASGNVLVDRTVEWSSLAPAVAAVSTTGLVTGVSTGAAAIRASVEGTSASAVVVVTVPIDPSPYVIQFVYASPSRSSNSADQATYVQTIDSLAVSPRFAWIDAATRQAYADEAQAYKSGQRDFTYWEPLDGSRYPGQDASVFAARAALVEALAIRVRAFYGYHTGRVFRLPPIKAVKLNESAMYYRTPRVYSNTSVDQNPFMNNILTELGERGVLPPLFSPQPRMIRVLLMDSGGGWAAGGQGGIGDFGGIASVGDAVTACLEHPESPGVETPSMRGKLPKWLMAYPWITCQYNGALGTTVHELGHAFGLPHPADFQCAGLTDALVMQAHGNTDLASEGYFRRPLWLVSDNFGIMKRWDANECKPTDFTEGYAAGIGTPSRPQAKFHSELEILLDNPHFNGLPAYRLGSGSFLDSYLSIHRPRE